MFRTVKDHVWAFDLEWVPDPMAGRLLYNLPDIMSDREVMRVMWDEAGATPDDPRPFLRTVLCRIVSVATVVRKKKSNGEVKLDLLSLPRDTGDPEQTQEAGIIHRFLRAMGKDSPQIVGYNSHGADLKILVQRGIVLGIEASAFCKRPQRYWDDRDYFHSQNEWNIDMCNILGGFGRGGVSLNQIAVLSGIPGKIDVDGNQVAELWLDGDWDKIIQYNEFDALTTYLVWLRLAHFACLFDDEQHVEEVMRVRSLIEQLIDSKQKLHLQTYLNEWNRLQAVLDHSGALV
jgi:predicted PolB exonuclease-like 3'-5' exonuclease